MDAFCTDALRLRRVKKTVNFDAPYVYRLCYGDEVGTRGSLTTCFPFPNAAQGRHGTGEVDTAAFSIPRGTSAFWANRLAAHAGSVTAGENVLGDRRVSFTAPIGVRPSKVRRLMKLHDLDPRRGALHRDNRQRP